MCKTAIGVLAAVLVASSAHATVVLTQGNNPQSGENNVLLNNGTTGTTVQGTINGFDAFFVNFTSTQTVTEPSSGQARIEAATGLLNNVTVSLTNNFAYGDILFNLHENGTPTAGNTLTISGVAAEPGGGTSNFSFSGLTLGAGENFYTLVASGGEAIISTTINSSAGANDMRQVRLSTPFTTVGSDVGGVPEPASMALLGLGLVGFALYRKRVRQ